jgi:hypothetical protein
MRTDPEPAEPGRGFTAMDDGDIPRDNEDEEGRRWEAERERLADELVEAAKRLFYHAGTPAVMMDGFDDDRLGPVEVIVGLNREIIGMLTNPTAIGPMTPYRIGDRIAKKIKDLGETDEG